MEGEYLSIETTKRIAQLEKDIKELNENASHLIELHKRDRERIDKAIEYLKSISMDKTPDYIPLKDYKEYHILLEILKGSDKE